MRAVLQRAAHASVQVEGKTIGEIGNGLLILLGVGPQDTRETAEKLAEKIVKLRIFSDENGKMNLSVRDKKYGVLTVSNFTLYADCVHGNRPSFTGSAEPKKANELYEYFLQCLKNLGVCRVEAGRFGADMKVNLLNDGPVTIVLDSDILYKKTVV